MQSLKLYTTLFLMFLLFAACNHERSEVMLLRLQQLDNALDDNPEAIKDSLKQINPTELSRSNKAYYNLLKTIANDKTYFDFTNDSLISKTEKQLHHYHKGGELHIRSLIYQGIVRYRMGVTDSTVFVPLKKAEKLYVNLKQPNPKIGYMMYYHLGKTLEKSDNDDEATDYYKKALAFAKMEENGNALFHTWLALFWNEMILDNHSAAKLYLDSIRENTQNVPDNLYMLNNAKSAYYGEQKDYVKKLSALQNQVELIALLKEKPKLYSLYYSMSDVYLNIGEVDSAMYYALSALEYAEDSLYQYNYLLFENVADIAEVQNDFETASQYRAKAADSYKQVVDRTNKIQMLELEKKYNYAEAENKVIKEKAKNRFYILLVLILVILMTALINYLKQKRKRNKLIINSINKEKEAQELRSKLLEHEAENLRIEYEKKELTNELYNQILNQFFKLENELREMADKSKLSNPDFADNIEELRSTMSKNLIESFAKKMTHKQFTMLTGISKPDNITKSELLMLFLITCDLTNKELAIVFRTTASSIRSRKHLLKNKMIELGADTSFF